MLTMKLDRICFTLYTVCRDNDQLEFHVLIVYKMWNSIPLHIRQSQTYSSFRRHLKTHYFISADLAP